MFRKCLLALVLSVVTLSTLNVNLAVASCNTNRTTGCYSDSYYSFMDCDCDAYGCTLPGPPYYLCFSTTCCTWSWACYPDAPCDVKICHTRDYVPSGSDCPCSGAWCWM